MWLFNAPPALLGLAALAAVPCAVAKPYPVHIEEFRQLHNATQLQERSTCTSNQVACGYDGWLCCPAGSTCLVDANNQAQCGGSGSGGGQWVYSTTTWVQTVNAITYTSVFSTYIPAAPTAAGCASHKSPCGTACCDTGYFCNANLQCAIIAGGSSGGIFPTVTYTGTPTATVPFQTAIPTGAAGGLVPTEGSGGGLSGGAIAGIVIGVILGILLLLLLCLFCCARALFDTIAAIFGFGKKRKHTHEETYIEEHRHSSGGAAAAGGGRWFGTRPSRPSRAGSEKTSGAKKGLGVAAVLGGLALGLGLKRKHDAKHDDKSTTVSGSSYYYSDYTSSSSASSSDRHTRQTRHSSRR
ncbi:hypothetical protein ACN47E_009286 [Coniothyrium glycines]